MKKLRVGVWINGDYKPEEGGGFGYYTQLINAICNYNFTDAEIIFIANKFSNDWDKKDKSYQIRTPEFSTSSLPIWYRITNRIATILNLQLSDYKYDKAKIENNEMVKKELSNVIDILYYPTPGCMVENFPYIYTLWDVGHLSNYAFPELVMNDAYEIRKEHHDLFPQKALMVFCESQSGKNEAIHFLNLSQSRIKVVPIFPSEIINDKINSEKPGVLKENSFFIHYPAQFWSHKNHYNLLLAFETVLVKFPNLKLIFSGSDKGNKEYISGLIKELNLNDSIIDLGFVKIEELKWIYQHSQGLVMPTLLGPTNMPLLEAAELNCSVACSNLEGHKEQLGDYGYYFDPLNAKEISKEIIRMIEDKQNGKRYIYHSNFNITNALSQIDKAFSEIKNIRFCWGTNDKIY
jgi:glycosyltransferase involved in cell wall biosynthesis